MLIYHSVCSWLYLHTSKGHERAVREIRSFSHRFYLQNVSTLQVTHSLDKDKGSYQSCFSWSVSFKLKQVVRRRHLELSFSHSRWIFTAIERFDNGSRCIYWRGLEPVRNFESVGVHPNLLCHDPSQARRQRKVHLLRHVGDPDESSKNVSQAQPHPLHQWDFSASFEPHYDLF